MAETFGEMLRRLRAEQDEMSLRELARRAHLDPGHLSRVQNEIRRPSPEVAAALDDALSADGALKAVAKEAPAAAPRLAVDTWTHADADELAHGLLATPPTADNALRLAHEWRISEPPQVYRRRAGRRIGPAAVAEVEQRVHHLRQMDDHLGGPDTRPLVIRELEATLALLRECSYTDVEARRLLAVTGELCQLAGWVTADTGDVADAGRLYLLGVRAAHAAGDHAGAASNLSSYAYQATNVSDPYQAVVLARSAARGADHGTGAVRALMWERVAWAHAKTGQAGPTSRALGVVEDAYAEGQVDADPAWTYWLDEDEISIMAGRCWTELGRPMRAVPLLEDVTSRFPDDRARELALYLTWLAAAYIQANEIEQAATTAGRALKFARQVSSTRSAERVEHVRKLLVPYHGVPAVDDFEDAARQTAS